MSASRQVVRATAVSTMSSETHTSLIGSPLQRLQHTTVYIIIIIIIKKQGL